jgi:hypothetical protein
MSEKPFDASRYLRKLNGKDYLDVRWRLLWLRSEHPEAAVLTELVKHESGLALFRARVSLREGGEATGWGSETASDVPEYIEAAETKALGRALAVLGYGTQFCDDFDTLPEASTAQPAPVAHAPVASPTASGRSPEARATAPQVKAIYSIGRGRRGLSEAEVEQRCLATYGCPPSELSRRQASQLIDALKAEP